MSSISHTTTTDTRAHPYALTTSHEDIKMSFVGSLRHNDLGFRQRWNRNIRACVCVPFAISPSTRRGKKERTYYVDPWGEGELITAQKHKTDRVHAHQDTPFPSKRGTSKTRRSRLPSSNFHICTTYAIKYLRINVRLPLRNHDPCFNRCSHSRKRLYMLF